MFMHLMAQSFPGSTVRITHSPEFYTYNIEVKYADNTYSLSVDEEEVLLEDKVSVAHSLFKQFQAKILEDNSND